MLEPGGLAHTKAPGTGCVAVGSTVGTAEGVTDFTVTAPAANVVPSLGQLATVGVITWS